MPVATVRAADQLTESTMLATQSESQQYGELAVRGIYKNTLIRTVDGVLKARTPDGWRMVLPPGLWATAFRETHGSIWSSHLRAPLTLARLQRNFWWPRMRAAVASWVSSCQDCGSRKVRPKQVIPPLRSTDVGAFCDRSAMDLAGPLHITALANVYVFAFAQYLPKYVVAVAVPNQAAIAIATALMHDVVLRHGPSGNCSRTAPRSSSAQRWRSSRGCCRRSTPLQCRTAPIWSASSSSITACGKT